MSTFPIAPIAPVGMVDGLTQVAAQPLPRAQAAGSFAQTLMNGVDQVNTKLIESDKLTAAFVVDDSIPIHQVTLALEQSRLSFELMMQVRSRLLEGYQEILRMQL